MKKYLLLSVVALGLGGIFYAWMHEYVIVAFPSKSHTTSVEPAHKKKCKIWYHADQQWRQELRECIMSEERATGVTSLFIAWLAILEEEGIVHKKVTLQSVLFDAHQQHAFVSFDRTPFDKEMSIFDKWMIVEGMLKTVADNGINLQTISLLVHHKPLNDPHLDFSRPWPLAGFL